MWRKCFLALLGSTAAIMASAGDDLPQQVHFRDIQSGKVAVIGELGVPLLTAVEIEAEVVEATKPGPVRYDLKILSVGGRKIPEPPVLEFDTVGDDRRITVWKRYASDDFETPEGYVGSRHTLLVKEVAKVDGWARNLGETDPEPPVCAPLHSPSPWVHFGTYLKILDEFPQQALDHPWAPDDVHASRLGQPIPEDGEAAQSFLMERFVRDPTAIRYSSLRLENWTQEAARFQSAILARAKQNGHDAESLARCMAAALKTNIPEGMPAVPVDAFVTTQGTTEVWIIVWALHFQSSNDDRSEWPTELDLFKDNRLADIFAQAYRASDGEAVTWIAMN